jgi:hypothetical protein
MWISKRANNNNISHPAILQVYNGTVDRYLEETMELQEILNKTNYNGHNGSMHYGTTFGCWNKIEENQRYLEQEYKKNMVVTSLAKETNVHSNICSPTSHFHGKHE